MVMIWERFFASWLSGCLKCTGFFGLTEAFIFTVIPLLATI